ncbi:MAG: hypothetical protein EPO43_06635 [Rugosibacter sp.]|nr:MAG: hypothetical protein EPO43_06635 [Rugosibacter sp.]
MEQSKGATVSFVMPCCSVCYSIAMEDRASTIRPGKKKPLATSSTASILISGARDVMAPNMVANATSAASRPAPILTSPIRGEMPVGSNTYQRLPRKKGRPPHRHENQILMLRLRSMDVENEIAGLIDDFIPEVN